MRAALGSALSTGGALLFTFTRAPRGRPIAAHLEYPGRLTLSRRSAGLPAGPLARLSAGLPAGPGLARLSAGLPAGPGLARLSAGLSAGPGLGRRSAGLCTA